MMNKPTISIRRLQLQKENDRDKIGQIWMNEGKITNDQADRAGALQDELRIRFGEAAKRLGFVTDDDIKEVLSRQSEKQLLVPESKEGVQRLYVTRRGCEHQRQIFRQIRTQLMLGWFKCGNKALAVTSMNSKEGTSTFIANLSLTFSQVDYKTLLVDGNFYAPVQHKIFGIENRHGLSDMLMGRVGMEGITKLEMYPGLYILGAGPLLEGSSDLISSNLFDELHQYLCSQFDVVLYDLPAFSHSSEALNIAALTQGLFVVVHKHNTHVADLKNMQHQLAENRIPIVGSVLLDY